MSDLPGMDIVLPPQSREAEDACVGAAIINPAALETIAFLKEEDFYFRKPREIWKAIQNLVVNKSPVDFITLSDRLEKTGELESIGGPAELASLINNVPSLNLEAYAKIVKDKSQRRALLNQANISGKNCL